MARQPVQLVAAPIAPAVGVQKDARRTADAAAGPIRRDLAAFFDISPDLVCVISAAGTYTYVNPAFERTLGYSLAELRARPFAEILQPDDIADALAQIAKVTAGDDALDFETRFRRKDGSCRWLLCNATAIHQGVTYWTARDITERKRSEHWFEELLEAAPDAMIGVATGGNIVLVNSQAERLFGYTRDQMVGTPVEMLLRERDRGVHKAHRDGYFANPEVRRIGADHDLHARRRDGSEFPAEIRLSSIATPNGVVAMASIRDVSERKAMEDDLRTTREAALESSRLKSEFVASMSHELRTPLNGVIGMTELLRDTTLGPAQREYVEALGASGEALLSVISDVLDFSKLEVGRLELDNTDFDLREAVAEACEMLAEQAHAKGLEIAHLVDVGVPLTVNGDRARLRQILLNLLSNAVKFTTSGAISLHVAQRGGRLCFAVSDTGVGIDRDQASALFEAFKQADQSTTRRYGGTGLGLAIARQLVELMGGRIGAQPRVGGGSVFWFAVPLPASERPPRAPAAGDLQGLRAPVAPAAAGRPRSDRGLLVLLAEDNEVNSAVAEALLGKLGLRTAVAHDGREAVEMAAEHDYDAIFMDCQMPEVDGFQATRKIRGAEGGHHVPIIAMTALAVRGDRERCLAAGMDDYLSKPVRREALAAVIDRWLPAERPRAKAPAPRDGDGPRPEPAPQAVPGVLDPSTIAHLRDAVSPGKRRELFDAFHAQQQSCVADIAQALHRGDRDEVRRATQLLKGSSASLGAVRLRLCCQRLEHAGRSTDPDIGEALLADLGAAADDADAALRRELT